MSQRGHAIDSLQFAREARTLTGQAGLSGMPRVAEQVLSFDGGLDYRLVGSREGRKLFLDLTASCRVRLVCQRCLVEFTLPLHLSGRFLLVAEGDVWPDDELEDDSYDAIVGSTEMDVVEMIEDEVLLALPVAPRHDVCDAPIQESVEERRMPFGVLASLKRH